MVRSSRSGISTGSEARAKTDNWMGARTKRKSELKEKNVQKKVPRLPPELWRQILVLLRTSEKLLVQLRLVSWQWRALIDEILRENSGPHLSRWISCQHTGSELWIQARNFASSRFNNWEKLNQALALPPEADWTGSPFPTGVVILCPYYGLKISSIFERDGIRKYNQCVPKFLARFGEWISTLVYFFHPQDTEFQPMSHLQGSILKMPHLLNLYMYRDHWGGLWWGLDYLPQPSPKTGSDQLWPSPSSLKRVQLGMASKQFCSFPSPILLFFRFPSALESVTSLEFDWPWDPPQRLNRMLEPKPNSTSRFLHCPQLRRLKIGNPTLEILRHFCKPGASKPRLQVLSLTVSGQKEWESWRLFRGLIPLLDKHSRSLTSFMLEVQTEMTHRRLIRRFEPGAEVDANLFPDTGVRFPRLKFLSLHLNMLMEPDWWPDVQILFWKFPNLARLSLPGKFRYWRKDYVYKKPEGYDGSGFVNFYSKKWLKELVPPKVAGIRLPDYWDRLVEREKVKEDDVDDDEDE